MLSQKQQKHVSKTNHSPEIEVNCVVYNSIPVVYLGAAVSLYILGPTDMKLMKRIPSFV